jgi:phosphatidylglycerophosphate synthase
MSDVLSVIRNSVRQAAGKVAHVLDKASKGRITPDMVTLFGLAMHVPTAVLIATDHPLWAAGFLIVFGLFDTLDGGLARLQDKASVRGMLLDASTDRFKEVMLYTGVAYWAVYHGGEPALAVWAVAACGASVCVSYVKAKGEAAVATGSKKIPHATLNRMFADGLLTFEIRMAVLVAGLLFNQLLPAVAAIAVLAGFTAGQRLVRISRQL